MADSSATPASGPLETTLVSVVLAGGGTAGHVSPLLALADCLRRRHPGVRITALGTEQGLEQRLVPARGYDLRSIPKVVFPRRPSAAALRLPGSLKGAVTTSSQVIADVGAQVVVGFGGYVSSPAYLAAKLAKVPIVVHEGNARPGLANRLGAALTPYVATTFSATKLPHAQLLGMPMRREITGLDRMAARPEALAYFGLQPEYPTVLVTGGSLGAQRLNDAFAPTVETFRRSGVQVLHVTGTGKEFAVPQDTADGPGYVVAPYVDRMDLAYAAADLVVCRAGANTVCELTAVGMPAIYVPLPIGNGEQRINAADVVAAGGGLIVEDASVTASWVLDAVVPLAQNEGRLAEMSAAAASVGEREADERLADLVESACAARG